MNDTFMKEKPIFPLLTSMALPMVISMLVNSLYNIVDSLFVARISEEAMTALSLVYPVQNLINAIAIGFSIGISSMISLHLGAGNQEKADTAATHGMVLSLLHGIIASVAGIAVIPRFLRSFTTDETVIALGLTYARIAFLFSVIIMAAMAFEKIFQAVGCMKITMAFVARLCLQHYSGPIAHLRYRPFPGDGDCRCCTGYRHRADDAGGVLSHRLFCPSDSRTSAPQLPAFQPQNGTAAFFTRSACPPF